MIASLFDHCPFFSIKEADNEPPYKKNEILLIINYLRLCLSLTFYEENTEISWTLNDTH